MIDLMKRMDTIRSVSLQAHETHRKDMRSRRAFELVGARTGLRLQSVLAEIFDEWEIDDVVFDYHGGW